MGDSITEGYASTAKFTDIIASALSATCNNYGIGGSTVANGQNPMYSRVLQMDEDADLCVVFGGTNDFANYDRILGEQFIASEGRRTLNVDTNTFYGGLNQLCTNLYSRFPYSTLVLCTPINRQSFAGQETDMQANGSGLYLDEYVEAIKKVAAYFSIPCLDLYATANLHPYDAANIAKYYSASDQLHPNAEGHKHLANVMLAFFDTLADKRGRTVEGDGSTHIHSYISAVTTAATCETAGVRTHTCSCGNSYAEEIPATGHIYVDGVCTVCGATKGTEEYSVSDMSGVLEVKTGGYYSLSGSWVPSTSYQCWKIPCAAEDTFIQCSTTGYGMYKTYWDTDGNLISSDTPANGSPTTFTVPNDANIAYMWTAVENADVNDGSYKLICGLWQLAETVVAKNGYAINDGEFGVGGTNNWATEDYMSVMARDVYKVVIPDGYSSSYVFFYDESYTYSSTLINCSTGKELMIQAPESGYIRVATNFGAFVELLEIEVYEVVAA